MALTKRFISNQKDEYPYAYIVVNNVVCRKKDTDTAMLETFKSVEARNEGLLPLEQVFISFNYDKMSTDDVFKQAYLAAKASDLFSDCEDV